MARVSPVEAAALSLGLSRLADQSPEWRPLLQSATPGLVRRAVVGAGALTATQLTWALHAAGRVAGAWLFDGPPPCPAAALADALAARLHEAAPLLRSGLGGSGWQRSIGAQEQGEGGGADDVAPVGPRVPRPNELSAAAAALVSINYYSCAAVQGLADCTVAALAAEEPAADWRVEATAGAGLRAAAGLGAADDSGRVTLVHTSRVLFACAKFDHPAPELVTAAARQVAASLQVSGGGGGDSSDSGGGGEARVVRSNAEVRPLALIAWAVAVLEPSRLDVARAVFSALAGCSPAADPQRRPSSGKPTGSGALATVEAPNSRVLRQLSQAEAIAALAARAAGQAAPQLPPLWRPAAAKAWAQGLFSGAGGASQTALAVAALLRRIGLDATLQQPTPDGRLVADIAVRYRGFTVALEVDGPNHFTAAPPSPSNAGGLFAAAPRRHHGDSRLRDLLLRANPGWLVAAVPWFDWRPLSRLPREGGMPSHYFRARLDDAVAPFLLLRGRGAGNGGRPGHRPGAPAAAPGAGWLEGGQLRWWAPEVQEQLERTGAWPGPPPASGEAAAARGACPSGAPGAAEAPAVAAAHQAERMAQWRELALQQLRWRRDADALLELPQGGGGPR